MRNRRLYDFMKARYGVDEFYKFLLMFVLFLLIINIFLNSIIIRILELIFIIVMIYRVFSLNKYKRVKENNEYLDLKRKVLNLFKRNKNSFIYKKCHKCKTILKLKIPNKRGIKHVKCPTCNKRNTYLIIKKSKI